MSCNLRPYQEEAVKAVLDEWDMGRAKTLLVLPTGCGKTVVFSKIIQAQVNKPNRKALVLAHRGELLTQAADKLKMFSDLECDFEIADQKAVDGENPVTVASVQSLSLDKRLTGYAPDAFTDIIVDEAHHCLSNTYQKILNYFTTANVLGVTATPDRGDKKDLGKFFDSVAYEYSLRDAVKSNYLTDIQAKMIPVEIDMSEITISQGDFSLGSCAHVIEPYLDKIADHMVEECRERKTVVFLPLIAISQKFCQMLNERGLMAKEVNGSSTDRDEILRDFELGKFDVLCNSMLLTEGWDCPSVDCIVVLRPTKVRSLYQQMVGRGLRPYPGKKNCLLLDFLWMTNKHDLCRPSSIVCKSQEMAEIVNKQVENSDEPVDVLEADEAAQRNILEERAKKLAEELERQRHKKAKLVDPLQYAFSIADEDLSDYVPSFDWERESASDKQIEAIEKQGISCGDGMSKGFACMLLTKLINRSKAGYATPKQIRLLERFGFINVGEWSKQDASNMISRLAMRNWKLPHGIDPFLYDPKQDKEDGVLDWNMAIN